MNIIKFKEQGFCFGVSRSIKMVEKILNDNNYPQPIYLLGDLVHNHYVNDYFSNKGIIVLTDNSRSEMIDKISSGTVIFTAHGVSEKVIQKAKDKKLQIIDATCPYVSKTVDKIKEQASLDKQIIYIGKKNHPEVETIISDIPSAIIIDETTKKFKITNKLAVLCHQTTLSNYDVHSISSQIIKNNPQIELLEQVCIFPEKRQQEINNYVFLKGKNLILVVGDYKSNNATKLKELSLRRKVGDVLMINSVKELEKINYRNYDNIYIASGTSTPMKIVDEIYNKIGEEK